MPDFYVDDIDISPSEFYDACTKREKERLIELFEDDGYTIIAPGAAQGYVINKEEEFARNLDILKGCKMMLTLEEENMLTELANKFKYIVTK